MKKILITALIIVSAISINYSQSYKTALGVRGGTFNGLTLKHFLGSNTAVEGILSTRWNGFKFTGLYELNNNTGTEGLDWYYGVGAHVGFWNGDHVAWGASGKDYTVIGVDGIIGLEYTFNEFPINLSLDWKPVFDLVGNTGFGGDGFALSVRYTWK